MKITTYDDDDTIFAFTLEKQANAITNESPRRNQKSSAYIVPNSNSHMIQASKHELQSDDTIIALINIIIFCLSYTQHTIFYQNDYSSTSLSNYLRILIIILSLSSILWLFRRYQIKLLLMLIKYKVSLHDTIYSTGLYKPMLAEIFLTLLVMPPYIDWTFEVEMMGNIFKYSFSAVFTFISIVRLYVIIRLFGHYSEYTHEKSEIVCKKHAVTADAYFSLKCYIKESPFMGIGIFFFFMSFFSSVAMMLCEEPQHESSKDHTMSDSSLQTLWDNLWTIFYTTTTIGYGNLYPITHLGRAVCIIACILGNMYLGMLILAINQKLNLDENQALSYAWISRNHFAKDIRQWAKVAIRKAATLYLLSKRWKGRTVSRIKPNGIVFCRSVRVRNDLVELNESQYKTKLKIYKELKKALEKVKSLNFQSREVGSNEASNIYKFEDAVRIDFPKVTKKLKGVVNKQDIESSDLMAQSCKPSEQMAEKIKDFSKVFKRKIVHALRKKTLQIEGGNIVVRRSNRSLTN